MPGLERVTVTLTEEIVRDIDRHEKNRSKFIATAVRHELDRLRRDELRQSLHNPHRETAELAEQGFDEWRRNLPDEDTTELMDEKLGKRIEWSFGEGWREPGQASTE